MDVGKAIYFILTNDSDVMSEVSNSGSDPRIFPSRFRFPTKPQSVQLPYITYQVVSVEPNNTKNGVSQYDYVTVQITIHSGKYLRAVSLASKVRTALDYVSGSYRGVAISKIFYQNENDLFDDSAGQQGMCGIAQDYRININR